MGNLDFIQGMKYAAEIASQTERGKTAQAAILIKATSMEMAEELKNEKNTGI